MDTSAIRADERVKSVCFSEESISVVLIDGRTITVPLVWYPRLLHATPEQREKWQVCGRGYGIHWEEIDEDLSTEGMLRGAPAISRRQVASKIDSALTSRAEKNNLEVADSCYTAFDKA